MKLSSFLRQMADFFGQNTPSDVVFLAEDARLAHQALVKAMDSAETIEAQLAEFEEIARDLDLFAPQPGLSRCSDEIVDLAEILLREVNQRPFSAPQENGPGEVIPFRSRFCPNGTIHFDGGAA